ncbi:hypothetical protein I553_9558 [Mycobacterium xenopi 4042]|uniref:PD-(D/E)XK endonuclease-like domain-containing protein n=1 Tax=Mycobacterium xenopi 4042 TaxID=1299334 RepID=X8DXM5_MYCXE|nr:hypothetical protein I553_9558 [Mycobacterium xenopi 4042]
MFVDDDTVIYSASDLVAACRCEYALLRVFDANLGRGPAVAVEDDDLLARAAALGDEHERRRLDQFREQFGTVVVIGRPPYTVAGLTAAAEATRRAIADGAPVVYQATVFDGRFAGFVDFLIRDGDRYRVTDTKLARSAQVKALLQLTAYAHGLASSGVAVAPEAELILGDGAVARYRVDELIPVYLAQRAALQRLLDDHYAAGVPVRWDDEDVRACFGCPECQAQLRASDDLLLVAGMRVSQRAKLIDAGITTVAQLARHVGPVPHLAARTLHDLTAQARLQVAERQSGTPQFEIADPQPLAVLPDPDDGDLFFDFEGDPLWSADGRDWAWSTCSASWTPRAASDRCGLIAGPRSARCCRAFWQWWPSAASATRTCTSIITPLTRRPRCYGWPDATASGRTKSTTYCATECWSTYTLWCARAFVWAPSRLASRPWNRSTWARGSAAATSPPPRIRSPSTPDSASCATAAARTRPRRCSRKSRTTTTMTAARLARCVTGCSSVPSNVVSHPVAPSLFPTATASTSMINWQPPSRTSSATPPAAIAPPNRPLWPCSPLPAAITGARTNRSGGRISIG